MKSALVQRTPSSPTGSGSAFDTVSRSSEGLTKKTSRVAWVTITNDKNYREPVESGSLAEAISRDHVGDGDIDSGGAASA